MPERQERPPERPDPDLEQPPLPVGLRMVLYYLVILTVFILGGAVCLQLLAPEAVSEGSQEIDFAILLMIQVLLAPLVVAATRIFAQKIDEKSLAALGAVWPEGGPERVRQTTLWATLLAPFLLSSWLLLVLAFAEVRWGAEAGAEPSVGGGVLTVGLFGLGFFIVALMEELIFRGYLFTTLRERLPWVHAGGVTALLFVLLHGEDPTISAAGLCNIFLLGLLLAALREFTGSLWPGAVFHAAWNTTIACLLSLPLGGEQLEGLLTVSVQGAEIFTGGEFGPEGSWLLTGPLVVLVMLFTWRLDPLLPEEEEQGETEQDGTGQDEGP